LAEIHCTERFQESRAISTRQAVRQCWPLNHEKATVMQFSHNRVTKENSLQSIVAFISDNAKLLFLSYLLLTGAIYVYLNNFSFLIGAVSAFWIIVLYAKNIRLSRETSKDKLTGLGNKKSLSTRLEKEIARIDRNGGYLTLLFFDIDNFKAINDTYGHKVGDCVLIEVANRLMAKMRHYDELIRYGGDEFCVICPQVKNEADSARIRDKLHSALHFVHRIENNDILIEASLGTATYPFDTDNMDDLISIADSRMYEQKKMRKLSRKASRAVNE
jgi:diguanylate cyclase (GGDEF)-like protein